MIDPLSFLQELYSNFCDGDWEHSYGIKIGTLDNPGWKVKIDLIDTPYAGRDFPTVRIERSEDDWIHYHSDGKYFQGFGGPHNLTEIIRTFQDWVGTVLDTQYFQSQKRSRAEVRRIYSLTRTWTTDDYSAVVDLASDCCRYFTFVIRKSSEAQDALTKLCPFLVCTKEVTEWPGTKLLGSESAQFFKYELNGESAEILKSSANRLWDWSFPQPEDLAFLRADGSPWFASIGHENDAFFKIADEEKDQIEGRFGAGSLKFDCEDELPDEKY